MREEYVGDIGWVWCGRFALLLPGNRQSLRSGFGEVRYERRFDYILGHMQAAPFPKWPRDLTDLIGKGPSLRTH